MMFGAWRNPDHNESLRIIHTALDAGINFIDTADVYGQGESEEIVGKALAGARRDDIILATKFHNAMGEDPNQQGNARRWIMRAVEDSLRRLGTHWIDLYQVHRIDPRTDIEETLAALSDQADAIPPVVAWESAWCQCRRRGPSGHESGPEESACLWRALPHHVRHVDPGAGALPACPRPSRRLHRRRWA